MREHGKRRPRLRTILLVVNLLVLILPLGSIYFLRIYENELVRQTESELLVQGAFIAAMYRQRLYEIAGSDEVWLGIPAPAKVQETMEEEKDEPYHPIPATIDLFEDWIYEPRARAETVDAVPDSLVLDVSGAILPVLKDVQRTTLAGIRVVDYQGLIVASTGYEQGNSLARIREIGHALRGEAYSIIRERRDDTPRPPLTSISRGSNIRVFVSMPIFFQERIVGAVYLSRTPRSILKALYEKRTMVLLLGLGLLTVAVLLGLLTSYTITRPVGALIGKARSLARGEKVERFPRGRFMAQEVEQLADAFQSMAEDIEYRTQYIRDFAMHVSHEFKTPLTAIQGSVELLQTHLGDMTEAQRERFLVNMTKDTDRLQRLVSRLLELARADVFEPSNESADIAAMGLRIRESFKDSDMEIEVAAEGGVRARIAPDVLETIIVALVDNSQQHGADCVRYKARRKGPVVELIIADNGEGVSPANVDKVFTPFFTTNRKNGGTGLGLSIVRALLTAHKGAIELKPGTVGGATFVITLPAENAR